MFLACAVLLCEIPRVNALFGKKGGRGGNGADESVKHGTSGLDEGIESCLGSEAVPGDVVPPSSTPDPWKGAGSPWENEEVLSPPQKTFALIFFSFQSGEVLLDVDLE